MSMITRILAKGYSRPREEAFRVAGEILRHCPPSLDDPFWGSEPSPIRAWAKGLESPQPQET